MKIRVVKKYKLTYRGETTYDYLSLQEVEDRINRILIDEYDEVKQWEGSLEHYMSKRSRLFEVEEYFDKELIKGSPVDE